MPGTLAETASLTAGYGAERRADMQNHVVELTAAMVGGPALLRLQDMTQSGPRSTDGDERTIAQLRRAGNRGEARCPSDQADFGSTAASAARIRRR